MFDYDWLTDETAVKVTTEENGYLYRVEELNGSRKVEITFGQEHEMLFDGEFVYAENFMAINGMLDAVQETETGVAVFVGEGEMYT